MLREWRWQRVQVCSLLTWDHIPDEQDSIKQPKILPLRTSSILRILIGTFLDNQDESVVENEVFYKHVCKSILIQ